MDDGKRDALMYHYSARQALMAAKQQELMNQAVRAKAVREARAGRRRRASWFSGAAARPGRTRGIEAAPGRPAEQPS
jgi:hypothetical protein